MANYISFLGKDKQSFVKSTSIGSAMAATSSEELVFMRVPGVPNPWVVHPIQNGRIRKDIILRGEDEIQSFTTVANYEENIYKQLLKSKMTEAFGS